jgi:hypothetical protein
VTRQRGGTTRRRDDEAGDTTSAEDIGRLLRDRREQRNLDLITVHDRLHRPITQIEALENGDLAGLPNQAQALSTLRRYAALLDLDGDAMALQMIDAWSTLPAQPAASVTPASAPTAMVTAVGTGPDHLRAFTQTGEVPKVGGSHGSAGSSRGSAYGYSVSTGPPTGTFPVVPRRDLKQSRRAVNRARRRLRAPSPLKAITWVVAVLLVAVVVGFGLLHWKSEWLVRSHILRVSEPAGSTSGASTSAASAKPAVVQTGTTAQSATYAVGSSDYDVVVAATGRCWIQVTSSTSSTPLVSGVQDAGKVLKFRAEGAMTVQVGSSSVLVGVTVNNKTVFYTQPKVVPYTYTFTSAA